MRFPQVSERVKEAPAHALRAVFASIGQVRLVTDRMKNKPGAEERATSTRPGESATAGTPAAEAAAATPVAEDTAAAEPAPAADVTPAAEPVPAAEAPAAEATPDADAAPAGQAEPETPAPTAAAPVEAATPVEAPAPPVSAPAEPAGAEPAAVADGAPPMANYEQLTIASLRARLRGLTIVQVRELISYEQAHAKRPDVIAMFERRVAKLEAPAEG